MSFRVTPQRAVLLEQEENLSGETEKERQGAKLRKAQRISKSLCASIVFAILR